MIKLDFCSTIHRASKKIKRLFHFWSIPQTFDLFSWTKAKASLVPKYDKQTLALIVPLPLLSFWPFQLLRFTNTRKIKLLECVRRCGTNMGGCAILVAGEEAKSNRKQRSPLMHTRTHYIRIVKKKLFRPKAKHEVRERDLRAQN